MKDIKNRAFKMWLRQTTEANKAEMVKLIYTLLSEQNQRAFDLVDEVGGSIYNKESYEKAADLVLEETENEK